MGIIHIILTILKVVGILLLVLLSILLLAVLAVLFCPVTYSASGSRDAEAYEGHVKIGWLFRLISFTFSFGSEEEGRFCIRILGIPLNRKKKEQKIQTSQEISEKTEEKLSKTAEEPSQKSVQETRAVEPKQSDAKKAEQKKPEQISGIPKKILDVFKKISLTVHGICDKINKVKEFLESERFARLKTLFFQEIKRILLHIRPRKVNGHIKIGTEEPYVTGQILAVAGIFFPLYGEHITIEPYFDQKILEGSIGVKGRIYGIFFVRFVWRLLWNADIRYMIKKIKQG